MNEIVKIRTRSNIYVDNTDKRRPFNGNVAVHYSNGHLDRISITHKGVTLKITDEQEVGSLISLLETALDEL